MLVTRHNFPPRLSTDCFGSRFFFVKTELVRSSVLRPRTIVLEDREGMPGSCNTQAAEPWSSRTIVRKMQRTPGGCARQKK